jgi:hypothetical protein
MIFYFGSLIRSVGPARPPGMTFLFLFSFASRLSFFKEKMVVGRWLA